MTNDERSPFQRFQEAVKIRRLRLVSDDLVAMIPDFAWGQIINVTLTEDEAEIEQKKLAANRFKQLQVLLSAARARDTEARKKYKKNKRLAEEYNEDEWVEDNIGDANKSLWAQLDNVLLAWKHPPKSRDGLKVENSNSITVPSSLPVDRKRKVVLVELAVRNLYNNIVPSKSAGKLLREVNEWLSENGHGTVSRDTLNRALNRRTN